MREGRVADTDGGTPQGDAGCLPSSRQALQDVVEAAVEDTERSTVPAATGHWAHEGSPIPSQRGGLFQGRRIVVEDLADGAKAGRRLLPAACLLLVGLYAFVALVALPEGDPLIWARLLALAAIVAVTCGVLAVARWGPRWLRGLGMLIVGSAAVVVLAGVVAERLFRSPSVTAVLGLLAGIAGIVLIVLGWQRLLTPIRRRWVRVATALVASLVLIQMVVLPATVALLVTNRARPLASGRTPADVGLAFEDVRITAADGTRLAAWWIRSPNRAAVIVLPGSGSTRDDALDHAAFIARAGFGTLLLDVRGHGDSGGRIMDLGWGADRDVSDAVSWLEQRGIARVGLFGFSMGGEVALTAASADPRVEAVVAEGATARTEADDALLAGSNAIARANTWLQFQLVELLAPEPEPPALVDAIRRIRVPVLLIEGGGPNEGDYGPRYAAAAPETVTLWMIPESPHIGGLSTRPEEYRDRVVSFLDEALG